MSTTDAWARGVLARAWPQALARPSPAELQGVQAIGRLEGFYGFASRPAGWAGSNNWGAIHCAHGPPCDGTDCFEAGDTTATGSSYRTCFRVYPSADAGAADLVHELYRRPSVAAALKTGDALAIATAMRRTGYHETAPEKYGRAIANNAAAIASSVGEPLLVRMGPGSSEASMVGPVLFGLALWAGRDGIRKALGRLL